MREQMFCASFFAFRFDTGGFVKMKQNRIHKIVQNAEEAEIELCAFLMAKIHFIVLL